MANSSKTEKKAVNKIRDLIDSIDEFKSNIPDSDKGIIWDGTIDLYNGDVDKVKNYNDSIDVQVKGRTSYNKKLKDKEKFKLNRIYISNYLKKDGTLFLYCVFKRDSNEYKIYYNPLLPYDIHKLLDSNKKQEDIEIKLKPIKNKEHLEKICRNFIIDRREQKKFNFSTFADAKIETIENNVTKLSVWTNDKNNFSLENMIGEEYYLYTYDEKGNAINVDRAKLENFIFDVELKIYNYNKKLCFEKVKFLKSTNNNKIIFGEGFELDLENQKFKYYIKGDLKTRLLQIKFLKELILKKEFYINDLKINIGQNFELTDELKKVFNSHQIIEEYLKKRNLEINLDLENWSHDEFIRLCKWLDAIDNHKKMNLKAKQSLLGSLEIKDFRFSIIAEFVKNDEFNIYDVFDEKLVKKYDFRTKINELEYTTNILYHILNVDVYLSRDVNIEMLKKYVLSSEYNENTSFYINQQILETIKAYDINKNIELLNYSEFLSNYLIEQNSNEINYINYYQILYRKNCLKDSEFKKIVEIQTKSNDNLVKLSCDILLENNGNIKRLINDLTDDEKEIFFEYPIYYLVPETIKINALNT